MGIGSLLWWLHGRCSSDMATSVSAAFTEFRRERVDIDRPTTETARNSRGYLVEQLTMLSQWMDDLPQLPGDYLSFGSFARSTKIRPLDDIDLMVFMASTRIKQVRWGRGYSYQVTVDN